MILSIKGSKLKTIYKTPIKELNKILKDIEKKIVTHLKEAHKDNSNHCIHELSLEAAKNAVIHRITILNIIVDNLIPTKMYNIRIEELAAQISVPHLTMEEPTQYVRQAPFAIPNAN